MAENYSDSILDYQHARQLLTDEAWAWATSYDQKKQLGLNKPEQFAILVHDNYTELLYFDSTDTRDNFVLQMQNQLGMLFDLSLEDQALKRKVQLKYDLYAPEFATSVYLQLRQRCQIMSDF